MIVAAIAGAAYPFFRVPSRPVPSCSGDSIVSGYGLTPPEADCVATDTRRHSARRTVVDVRAAFSEAEWPALSLAHP